MEIKDKVILITGGMGSLGIEIAKAMELRGAKILIFDCIDSPMENVFKVDVTNNQLIEEALEKIEKIDILINCAGEIYSEPILNVMEKKRHSKKSWDRIINNNLNSCFLMSSYVAQKMIANRTKGVIINFSSVSAKGNMGQAAYSAAKAGVEAFTNVLSKELGMFKIRACAVAPGFIETPSTHNALSDAMIDYWKKNTSLRKLGQVEDVVSTIEFIIKNDFITGTVIEIDGGVML